MRKKRDISIKSFCLGPDTSSVQQPFLTCKAWFVIICFYIQNAQHISQAVSLADDQRRPAKSPKISCK